MLATLAFAVSFDVLLCRGNYTCRRAGRFDYRSARTARGQELNVVSADPDEIRFVMALQRKPLLVFNANLPASLRAASAAGFMRLFGRVGLTTFDADQCQLIRNSFHIQKNRS
jgi:hypothetical protein